MVSISAERMLAKLSLKLETKSSGWAVPWAVDMFCTVRYTRPFTSKAIFFTHSPAFVSERAYQVP